MPRITALLMNDPAALRMRAERHADAASGLLLDAHNRWESGESDDVCCAIERRGERHAEAASSLSYKASTIDADAERAEALHAADFIPDGTERLNALMRGLVMLRDSGPHGYPIGK